MTWQIMINPPNFFDYATSELSQDAWICWLLAWANPDIKLQLEEKNSALHKCGKELIAAFFGKHNKSMPAVIESIDVKRQYNKIDILCILNGKVQAKDTDKYAILIEDKVGTEEHSGQLDRYKDIIARDYDENKIILIYIQTWYQSSYEDVERSGYKPFLRADLLKVLDSYDGDNAILLDYWNYLKGIENDVQAYKTKSMDDWEDSQWVGFYIRLQEEFKGCWGKVNNARGGFIGFWWSFLDIEESASLYLQLAQDELCFKIQAESREAAKLEGHWYLCKAWQERICEESKFHELAVEPTRIRRGEYMTICVCKDYRVPCENGGIDMQKTIERLQQAMKFLETVVNKTQNDRDSD
ncbi:MAG: PD-(D/E)XK nuclease family protein [Gammaproteobacteria bacterium]